MAANQLNRYVPCKTFVEIRATRIPVKLQDAVCHTTKRNIIATHPPRFSRSIALPAFAFAVACVATCVGAQKNAPPEKPPLRALIVGGGPSLEQNEYAIESNTRYLETLSARAKWRRIHFADGSKASRTVSAVQTSKLSPEAEVLNWMLDDYPASAQSSRRASGLKRIDGASTKPAVSKALQQFARAAPDERGLVYFTGHGSPGIGTSLQNIGEDYENTTHALWNGGTLSVREMASALKDWPAKSPLVLVMVQCHSGGFANVMREDGDPSKPLIQRDFCGFFAATGDRQSAGCTAEMDERLYQDFTTHFFAALSGRTREGRRAPNADYDRNGAVSMSEAFAAASVSDRSIDVPTSTSDTFLRQTFAQAQEPGALKQWTKTPFSQVRAAALPWQRAMLDGLSRELKLAGETRVNAAMGALGRASQNNYEDEQPEHDSELGVRFYRVEDRLFARFPALRERGSTGRTSSGRASQRTRRAAERWLRTQKADVAFLHHYLNSDRREVRAAMLLRFVRAARTVALQTHLLKHGTAQQKQDFARLRQSESRNPL